MSYQGAIEDGIPYSRCTGYNATEYYPPCFYCGQPTRAWTYRREFKYACPECRKEVVAQKREEMNERNATKKQKKLKTAIKRISAVADISKYEHAIKWVTNALEHPGWF